MTRTVLALFAASALVLTACATVRSITGTTSFDPENPQIFVVRGATGHHIIVDQEPIVITKKGKSRITWHVATKGYEFDKAKGIVINPTPVKGISKQVTGCTQVTNTQFACDNDNNGKGVHSYTINLVGPAGPLKVDPYVVND